MGDVIKFNSCKKLDINPYRVRSEIEEFFKELAANQYPLEKEFQDVLNENRWDLYVKS